MASYAFDYAIKLLRQAIDFAEIEGDFVPLRKWADEIEQSGHDQGVRDGRLNLPIGQEVLLAALRSVAAGSVSPEEALQRIHSAPPQEYAWVDEQDVVADGVDQPTRAWMEPIPAQQTERINS